MTDPLSFVTLLGGPEKVAQRLGIDANTPVVWVSRKRIPRQSWPELMLAFPKKATLKRLLETEKNSSVT